MKFGVVPLDEALGGLLAHSVKTDGKRFPKGHLLQQQDIELLAMSGYKSLTVARLDRLDIVENEAATRIGEALAGEGIRAQAAFTGRVNLYAERGGLFDIQRADVDRFNGIDPAITLATLPEHQVVEPGRMLATVKIIPLAVDGAAVEQAVELARDAYILSVCAPIAARVHLIQTTFETTKPSMLSKTRAALEKRLTLGQGEVVGECRCAHDTAALEAKLIEIDSLPEFDEDKDVVIIFGASAITDQADTIPAALEVVGGSVTWFGMPVDPGNLLMVGRFGGRAVIGAPGCARSPAENGFDWVLQRVLHGAHVDGGWITMQGVGGLLMEIHDRPQPRERARG